MIMRFQIKLILILISILVQLYFQAFAANENMECNSTTKNLLLESDQLFSLESFIQQIKIKQEQNQPNNSFLLSDLITNADGVSVLEAEHTIRKLSGHQFLPKLFVREVIANAIDAYKYSSLPPSKRNVEVSLKEESDKTVQVMVKDNGVGMSLDDILTHLLLPNRSDKGNSSESKSESKSIGQFGQGFFSTLGRISANEGEVIIETKKANSPGQKIIFTKDKYSKIWVKVEPLAKTDIGTSIIIRSKNNLKSPKEQLEVIKERFRYNTQAKIVVEGEKINPLPLSDSINNQNNQNNQSNQSDKSDAITTSLISNDTKNKGHGVLSVNVNGVMIENFHFEGINFHEEMGINLPKDTQLTTDREHIDYKNPKTIEAFKKLIVELISNKDWVKLNTLAPLLSNEAFGRSLIYDNDIISNLENHQSSGSLQFLPSREEFLEFKKMRYKEVILLDSKYFINYNISYSEYNLHNKIDGIDQNNNVHIYPVVAQNESVPFKPLVFLNDKKELHVFVPPKYISDLNIKTDPITAKNTRYHISILNEMVNLAAKTRGIDYIKANGQIVDHDKTVESKEQNNSNSDSKDLFFEFNNSSPEELVSSIANINHNDERKGDFYNMAHCLRVFSNSFSHYLINTKSLLSPLCSDVHGIDKCKKNLLYLAQCMSEISNNKTLSSNKNFTCHTIIRVLINMPTQNKLTKSPIAPTTFQDGCNSAKKILSSFVFLQLSDDDKEEALEKIKDENILDSLMITAKASALNKQIIAKHIKAFISLKQPIDIKKNKSLFLLLGKNIDDKEWNDLNMKSTLIHQWDSTFFDLLNDHLKNPNIEKILNKLIIAQQSIQAMRITDNNKSREKLALKKLLDLFLQDNSFLQSFAIDVKTLSGMFSYWFPETDISDANEGQKLYNKLSKNKIVTTYNASFLYEVIFGKTLAQYQKEQLSLSSILSPSDQNKWQSFSTGRSDPRAFDNRLKIAMNQNMSPKVFISELIKNAKEKDGEANKIKFNIYKNSKQDTFSYEVIDNGKGMPKEILERMAPGFTTKFANAQTVDINFGQGFFSVFNPNDGINEVYVESCVEGGAKHLLAIRKSSPTTTSSSSNILEKFVKKIDPEVICHKGQEQQPGTRIILKSMKPANESEPLILLMELLRIPDPKIDIEFNGKSLAEEKKALTLPDVTEPIFERQNFNVKIGADNQELKSIDVSIENGNEGHLYYNGNIVGNQLYGCSDLIPKEILESLHTAGKSLTINIRGELKQTTGRNGFIDSDDLKPYIQMACLNAIMKEGMTKIMQDKPDTPLPLDFFHEFIKNKIPYDFFYEFRFLSANDEVKKKYKDLLDILNAPSSAKNTNMVNKSNLEKAVLLMDEIITGKPDRSLIPILLNLKILNGKSLYDLKAELEPIYKKHKVYLSGDGDVAKKNRPDQINALKKINGFPSNILARFNKAVTKHYELAKQSSVNSIQRGNSSSTKTVEFSVSSIPSQYQKDVKTQTAIIKLNEILEKFKDFILSSVEKDGPNGWGEEMKKIANVDINRKFNLNFAFTLDPSIAYARTSTGDIYFNINSPNFKKFSDYVNNPSPLGNLEIDNKILADIIYTITHEYVHLLENKPGANTIHAGHDDDFSKKQMVLLRRFTQFTNINF
ncbi:MAG: ATP-binding protein [Oligoflexia bacterium]|nr:ATP-binding protein [Oligoflexia bacterium]